MNELVLKNLEVGVIDTGCTYLDFATGNLANLTATPITPNDAAVDLAEATANAANILAVTLIPNALNTLPDYISNATGAVYLPVCTKGTHVALTLLGDMDEATAFNIYAQGAVGESDAVFAKQVVSAIGKGGIGVITAGTTAVPTSVKLIYTPATADTNVLGIGSTLQFYAHKDGEWLVRVGAIAEGTGATGTFTVA
tara:strand:- start:3 stop:593 length:591 start_codon:yes stop_codon:yes gene_type:complete